ncbi:hypothetical protein T265_09623 [Opisthorchis viverrini]|uniref:Uncharacterized protein n=1 Tax=Opisthorchis viverrini TaxID=6198 RepID=A0A075A4B3_OPIVI|nr:hypothetical protein T265_09623 [Opisthorchis viverrini]KER22229.1 hypothetical protein T265_09623 [Opisthorchis viverrini]
MAFGLTGAPALDGPFDEGIPQCHRVRRRYRWVRQFGTGARGSPEARVVEHPGAGLRHLGGSVYIVTKYGTGTRRLYVSIKEHAGIDETSTQCGSRAENTLTYKIYGSSYPTDGEYHRRLDMGVATSPVPDMRNAASTRSKRCVGDSDLSASAETKIAPRRPLSNHHHHLMQHNTEEKLSERTPHNTSRASRPTAELQDDNTSRASRPTAEHKKRVIMNAVYRQKSQELSTKAEADILTEG